MRSLVEAWRILLNETGNDGDKESPWGIRVGGGFGVVEVFVVVWVVRFRDRVGMAMFNWIGDYFDEVCEVGGEYGIS